MQADVGETMVSLATTRNQDLHSYRCCNFFHHMGKVMQIAEDPFSSCGHFEYFQIDSPAVDRTHEHSARKCSHVVARAHILPMV